MPPPVLSLFGLFTCVFAVLFAPHRAKAQSAVTAQMVEHGKKFYKLLEPLITSPADVVFVVDASGSVSRLHFAAEIKMVNSILFRTDVSSDTVRTAILTFSSGVHSPHWNSIANPSLTKCSLDALLKRGIQKISGGTATAEAVAQAGTIFGDVGRSGVNRVVITMTDGEANDAAAARAAADSVRNMYGATLFALGFDSIEESGLRDVASDTSHVFHIGDPENVAPFSKVLKQDAVPGGSDVVSSSLCTTGCANGQCTCGRVSGVYQCSCRDGYFIGGSGLCEACPLGQYKGIGDQNCKKCINHATTQATASTSINDCICDIGYMGSGSVECTPVTCPDPTLSNNGEIVGDCEKMYNTPPCKVGCCEGYKLTSAELITCQANRQWSGLPHTCAIQQCPSLSIPEHAENVICTDGDNYKSTCTMNCKLGYKQIEGSQERTCQSSLAWDGEPLQCEQVTCPPLTVPENGALVPPDCNSVNQIYNAVCRYNCIIPGYRLTPSISEVTCRETGTWSYKWNFECKDVTKPTFEVCHDDLVVETFPGLAVATDVYWFGLRDQVEDNSGEKPTVSVEPRDAEVSTREWPIGSHRVTYSATDSAGNIGHCKFQVIVIDKELPKVVFCPKKQQRLVGNDGKRKVEWKEPQFTDNSGLKIGIIKSHESGSRFEIGEKHVVKYTASDPFGNSETCEFAVRIVPYLCEAYEPPENGALSCREGLVKDTSICQVSCRENYKVPQKLYAKAYYCSDEKKWRGFPTNLKKKVPWPNCGPVKKSTRTKSVEVSTFAEDCGSPKAQKQLLKQLKELLVSQGVCKTNKKCKVDNVEIQCGEVPSRKRATRFAITFKFDLVSLIDDQDDSDGGDDDVAFVNATRIIEKVFRDSKTIGEALKVNGTALIRDNATAVVTISETRQTCGRGQVLQDDGFCLSCPVGSQFSAEESACVICPVGYYQDEEAQTECKSCPPGYSTTGESRSNPSDCIPTCPPGTFSESGVETCTSCARGFYQPDVYQTSCIQCPPGTTTRFLGAANVTECLEPCPLGTFSLTGLVPCQPCPRGFYQNRTNQRECIECQGDLTTIEEGAQNEEECIIIDECTSLPCNNDGLCVDGDDSFVCVCPPGFTGLVCETDIDECASSPCRHDSTCTDRENGYTCDCPCGFVGVDCETNVDECASSPCRNGATCRDRVDGYACECATGFKGRRCDLEAIACASSPCRHGGTCNETDAGFECRCRIGYLGERCEIVVDACALSSPCRHKGTCTTTEFGYECKCRRGFSGENCEIDENSCAQSPCRNGATCRQVGTSFECDCAPGYGGSACDSLLPPTFDLSVSVQTDSSFSRSSAPVPDMTSATMAFWIRTSHTGRGTVVSYASSASLSNALSIQDYTGFVIYVNNDRAFSDVSVNDGQWHHVVVTWTSSSGAWSLYKGGQVAASGTGLQSGGTINGGGMIVIGQDQDVIGGGFVASESMVGSVSQVNVWKRVLNGDEIRRLFAGCNGTFMGDVAAWPDFRANAEGAFQVASSSSLCNQIDQCTSSSCQNGGQCEDLVNDFQCHCRNGYTGAQCAQLSSVCNPNPCGNGSECIDRGRFVCVCAAGFTAERCEIDVDECSSNPCQNGGQCVDRQRGYSCNCPEQFSGSHCEKDANECELGIHNCSQICRNTFGGYECLCQSRYRLASDGFSCEDFDECAADSDGCQHGCVNTYGSFLCVCPTGYTISSDGVSCEDLNECQVGGYCSQVCRNEIGGYKCSCQLGYVLAEDNSTCQGVSCGDPGPASRGFITGTEFTFPHTIRYSCDEGYRLNGTSRRSCQANGEWSGVAPTCRPVKCSFIKAPRNGTLSADGDDYQSLAKFACLPGNVLTGDSSRQCQASGIWSGKQPTCTYVSCGSPGQLQNGTINARAFSFDFVANYSCDIGHFLVGKSTAVCLASGRWSSRVPKCRPVACQILNVPVKGRRIGKGHHYSDVVRFRCVRGYRMIGSASRSCQANGLWSGQQPTCILKNCGAPGEIRHGSVLGSTFTYGSSVYYSCDDGYSLVGARSRLCRASGRWSAKQPTCRITRCGKLRPPMNGEMSTTKRTHGTAVAFTCKYGYRLLGVTTRECVTGQWTGTMPQCVRSTCGRDFSASSGDILSPGYPTLYKNNLQCIWRITTSPSTFATLSFYRVTLTRKDDCVEVRDGHAEFGTLLNKICGPTVSLSRPVTARSNRLNVRFVTGSFGKPGQGFWAKFSESQCGGYESTFQPRGQVLSPNYRSVQQSPRGVDCYWVVRPNPTITKHECLQLSFVSFNLRLDGRIEIAPDPISSDQGQNAEPVLLTRSIEQRVVDLPWRSFWLQYWTGSGRSSGKDFKIVYAEGSSCADIARRGCSRGSDFYWIYPHTGVEPFQVHCDMSDRTKEGWTLVARLSNADPIRWSGSTFWQDRLQSFGNVVNPNGNADMISEAFWMVDGKEIRFTRSDNGRTISAGSCLSSSHSTLRSYIAHCCRRGVQCSCLSIAVCSTAGSSMSILPDGAPVGMVTYAARSSMSSMSEADFVDQGGAEKSYAVNVWVG